MQELLREIIKNPILILPAIGVLLGYGIIILGFWEIAMIRIQKRAEKILQKQQEKFFEEVDKRLKKYFSSEDSPKS
jgi:stalled ribosome rescue protein Dom34